MTRRAAAFIIVGAGGFTVQIAMLAWLVSQGWPLAVATAVAVESAVLHNFGWHERWTWRDRAPDSSRITRLARFHAAAGMVSLVSNVVLTWVLATLFHLPAVVANALAVGAASVANYVAADRWVFARSAAAFVAVCALASSASAAPSSDAVEAWNAYVHDADATPPRNAACVPGAEPVGESRSIEGGTLHRWAGCTVVPHTTVNALINALIESGAPPQDDVLESRVLERSGDSLRVYLKLIRRTIITVTYDTEHEMTFHRRSADLATSRSRSTRIAETDGGDHGFLWRLNSYWTYLQEGDAVRVELVSLSLSRNVPRLIRPVAGPIVAGVARESMVRTLEALRRFVGGRASRGAADGTYRVPNAATVTPADTSAARMRAARLAAPGASPCRQTVSTRIGTSTPSRVSTEPSTAMRTACVAAAASSSITAPATRRGTSRPSAS
jgi:putative flippase GtrA